MAGGRDRPAGSAGGDTTGGPAGDPASRRPRVHPHTTPTSTWQLPPSMGSARPAAKFGNARCPSTTRNRRGRPDGPPQSGRTPKGHRRRTPATNCCSTSRVRDAGLVASTCRSSRTVANSCLSISHTSERTAATTSGAAPPSSQGRSFTPPPTAPGGATGARHIHPPHDPQSSAASCARPCSTRPPPRVHRHRPGRRPHDMPTSSASTSAPTSESARSAWPPEFKRLWTRYERRADVHTRLLHLAP